MPVDLKWISWQSASRPSTRMKDLNGASPSQIPMYNDPPNDQASPTAMFTLQALDRPPTWKWIGLGGGVGALVCVLVVAWARYRVRVHVQPGEDAQVVVQSTRPTPLRLGALNAGVYTPASPFTPSTPRTLCTLPSPLTPSTVRTDFASSSTPSTPSSPSSPFTLSPPFTPCTDDSAPSSPGDLPGMIQDE